MANSNKQARKIETTKVTLSIIAVLLILATITVGIIGYFSQGFKNWDTENWGEKPVSAASIVDGDGNDLSNPDKVYPMPSNIIFTAASTAAIGDRVYLRPTISPANATNTNINWSIDWVNSSSEWVINSIAQDADYYVEFGKVSDGSVFLELKKPFKEQIKLTAISESNPEVKAECLIDCRTTVTSILVKYVDNNEEFFKTSTVGSGIMGHKKLTYLNLNNANTARQITFQTQITDGTIPANVTIGNQITFKLNSRAVDFLNHMKAYDSTLTYGTVTEKIYTINLTDKIALDREFLENIMGSFGGDFKTTAILSHLFGICDWTDLTKQNEYIDNPEHENYTYEQIRTEFFPGFISYLEQSVGQDIFGYIYMKNNRSFFECSYNYEIDGERINNYVDFFVSFKPNTLPKNVSSISLDQTSIVF